MTTRVTLGLVMAIAAMTPVAGLADVDVDVNIGVPPAPRIIVPAPPQLVLVPGVPAVHYAPALSVDLFFHDGRWYHPHGGFWYVGRSYRGPWTPVVIGHVPRAVLAVPVIYYKVPPGHLKHHKWKDRHGSGGPHGHGKGKHR
jgi:hypothetical protein